MPEAQVHNLRVARAGLRILLPSTASKEGGTSAHMARSHANQNLSPFHRLSMQLKPDVSMGNPSAFPTHPLASSNWIHFTALRSWVNLSPTYASLPLDAVLRCVHRLGFRLGSGGSFKRSAFVLDSLAVFLSLLPDSDACSRKDLPILH